MAAQPTPDPRAVQSPPTGPLVSDMLAVVPSAVTGVAPASAAVGAAGGAAGLSAAAVAQSLKVILAAFVAFQDRRKVTIVPFLRATVARQFPERTPTEVARIAAHEVRRENEFRVKQLKRLRRDLPDALSVEAPGDRAAEVQRILARERGYTQMREAAMTERAVASAEYLTVKEMSPLGAYWRLSRSVREHTPDCVAMGEKFWPHEVLEKIRPPVHVGCPCRLHTLDEALDAEWMDEGQVPDTQDAIRRAKAIMEQFKVVREAALPGEVEQAVAEILREARKHDPEYEAETARIKVRAATAEAKGRHKFRAAKWTHPNGHPRCALCGEEERVGGVCHGEPSKAEAEAWAAKENRDGIWGDSAWVVSDSGKLSLDLAEASFEPGLHPRDRLGRWRDKWGSKLTITPPVKLTATQKVVYVRDPHDPDPAWQRAVEKGYAQPPEQRGSVAQVGFTVEEPREGRGRVELQLALTDKEHRRQGHALAALAMVVDHYPPSRYDYGAHGVSPAGTAFIHGAVEAGILPAGAVSGTREWDRGHLVQRYASHPLDRNGVPVVTGAAVSFVRGGEKSGTVVEFVKRRDRSDDPMARVRLATGRHAVVEPGDLVVTEADFNPLLHPRDREGKWSDTLARPLIRRALADMIQVGTPKQRKARGAGRDVWLRGVRTKIPEQRVFSRSVAGVHYTSPVGSTRVYRNGKEMPEGHPELQSGTPPHAYDLGMRTPGSEGEVAASAAAADTRVKLHAGATERAADALVRPSPDKPPAVVGADPLATHDGLENAGFIIADYTTGPKGQNLRYVHVDGHELKVTYGQEQVESVEWSPGGQHVREVVPQLDHPPGSWLEWTGSIRSFAHDLAAEHGTEPYLTKIEGHYFLEGFEGRHTWGGEILLGKDVRPAIETMVAKTNAGEPLTQRELRGVFESYKVAVHEGIHAASPISRSEYQDYPEGRPMEEALVEELAHLHTANLLERHGLGAVVDWVRENPFDPGVVGTYSGYRSGLDSMMNSVKVAPEERLDVMERMKFGTPSERFTILGEMAGPFGSSLVRSRAAGWTEFWGGKDAASVFFPVASPSGRPVEDSRPFRDGVLHLGADVSIVRAVRGSPGQTEVVEGTVIGFTNGDGPVPWTAQVQTWPDMRTAMAVVPGQIVDVELNAPLQVDLPHVSLGVGDLVAYDGIADGSFSEGRVTRVLSDDAPDRWVIEVETTAKSKKPGQLVYLTAERVGGQIHLAGDRAFVPDVAPSDEVVHAGVERDRGVVRELAGMLSSGSTRRVLSSSRMDTAERSHTRSFLTFGKEIPTGTASDDTHGLGLDASLDEVDPGMSGGSTVRPPVGAIPPGWKLIGDASYETTDGRFYMYRIPGLRPPAWNVEWATDYANELSRHENADLHALGTNHVDGAATKKDAVAIFADEWPRTRALVERLEAGRADSLGGMSSGTVTPETVIERPNPNVTIWRTLEERYLTAFRLRDEARRTEQARNLRAQDLHEEAHASEKIDVTADPEYRTLDAEAQAAQLALAAAERDAGGRVFRVPTEQLATLEKRFEKLVKAAERVGVAPPTVTDVGTESSEYRKPGSGVPEGKGARKTWIFKVIRGEEPKIAGWDFLATLQHVNGVNVIRRVPGKDEGLNLDHYRDGRAICDYCNLDRKRKDTYIVKNDTSGEMKQVGSNCIRDFLGHGDPAAIASYLEHWYELDSDFGYEDDEAGGGGGGRREVPVDAYLGHVALMIRTQGWTPRSKAWNGPATADRASANFSNIGVKNRDGSPAWEDPSDDDYKRGEDTLTWLRTDLANRESLSEFEHNMVALSKGDVVPERGEGILAYTVVAHSKEIEREVERARIAKAGENSRHVGTVGERIPLRLTVESIFEHDGKYGVTFITKLADDDGNVFKWFASQQLERGKTYEGKFTVKKHDEFKGVLETQITRPVGLEEYDPDRVSAEKPKKVGERGNVVVNGEKVGEIEKVRGGFVPYLEGAAWSGNTVTKTWREAEDMILHEDVRLKRSAAGWRDAPGEFLEPVTAGQEIRLGTKVRFIAPMAEALPGVFEVRSSPNYNVFTVSPVKGQEAASPTGADTIIEKVIAANDGFLSAADVDQIRAGRPVLNVLEKENGDLLVEPMVVLSDGSVASTVNKDLETIRNDGKPLGFRIAPAKARAERLGVPMVYRKVGTTIADTHPELVPRDLAGMSSGTTAPKWKRIEDGYERGVATIHDNGGGLGPAKGTGRWAVSIKGQWVANVDTLDAAKEKADDVISRAGLWADMIRDGEVSGQSEAYDSLLGLTTPQETEAIMLILNDTGLPD